MKNIFYTDKVYPRWLILLIDQIIVTWALIMSFLMANRFEYTEIFTSKNLLFVLLYSVIAITVFVSMRIHTGIIRHSGTEDILRVFVAVLLTSFVFGVTSKLIVFSKLYLVGKWIDVALLINFFISTTLLIIFRIGVKNVFAYLKDDIQQENNKQTVLIYGTDCSSILMRKAIESNKDSGFCVLGFIDDKQDKVNKSIEQKKVFPSSSIEMLRSKHSVTKMIVLEDCEDVRGKKLAIKHCIDHGIKVVSVPPARQWLDGRLSLNQFRELKIEDLLQREPINLKKNSIFKEIAGKRILVTGAAGSIGSEIVRQVLTYNPELLVLYDQAETPLHELQLELEDNYLGSRVRLFMASIQNESRLRMMFETYKPQIVFHAAACKHVPMMENNPLEAVMTNVGGTKNLADLSVEYQVDKFIMISTDKAVKPTNVMGASKRIAEIYTQSLSNYQETTKFITTRFGNVLGSNGSVVPRFKNQIEKGGPVTITHPEITRYFMTIPEAVQLVLEASAIGNGGEIFVFDMGKPIKIVDLAINMIRLAGLCPEKDIPIVFTGLRPGEKLYEELLNEEELIIPTDHAKIKISRVIDYEFGYIHHELSELLDMVKKNDNVDVVRKMREIVPEFKSNNSAYNTAEMADIH